MNRNCGEASLALSKEELFNSQNCPSMKRIIFAYSEFPITA